MKRAFCSLAILSAVGVLQAGTLTWTGDTTSAEGGLTWHRPTIADDPATVLATVGGGETYVAEEITVGTSGTYAFSVQANGPGSGDWNGRNDILGFLYLNPFDASTPLVDELYGGGPGAVQSWSYHFTAGTDYWIVITGYMGTGSGSTLPAEGPFKASLTGPGTVTALRSADTNVPEPGSLLLAVTATVGLIMGRKRFRRSASAI